MIQNTIERKVNWIKVCYIDQVPEDGGACIYYEGEQIALFHFASRGEWFATQNMCPHKMQMALSRGMIGDKNGEPKVICPFHKKTYSLVTGKNLDGENYEIKVFPVKIENNTVYIGV